VGTSPTGCRNDNTTHAASRLESPA